MVEFFEHVMSDPEERERVLRDVEPIVWLVHRMVHAREAAGLNLDEVAKRSGIAPADLEALEAGECDPRWTDVVAYLRACNQRIAIIDAEALLSVE